MDLSEPSGDSGHSSVARSDANTIEIPDILHSIETLEWRGFDRATSADLFWIWKEMDQNDPTDFDEVFWTMLNTVHVKMLVGTTMNGCGFLPS